MPMKVKQTHLFSINSDTLPPHVQTCIRCYTADWKVVRYQHRALSSSVGSKTNAAATRIILTQSSPKKQEFEIDFHGICSESNSELGKS